MDLRLEVTHRDGWTVLHVGGEVDVATAPRLREGVVGLIGDGTDRLVIDLGEVDFIDSTGLGVLISALKRMRSREGELRLVAGQPRTVKVFEITGLDSVFDLHDDLDAAVAP